MGNIRIEEKYILEYIRDSLLGVSYSTNNEIIDRYHHNTGYSNLKLVLEYGILNLENQVNMGIKSLSNDTMQILSDINSHINGTNGISLAVMGLTDLYEDEMEYNSFDASFIDIVVSNNVKASRNSENYGNEFICYHSITTDMFKSIDIRLIEYINKLKLNYNNYKIEKLINKYNKLVEASLVILDKNLDVDLREMSDSCTRSFDIEKVKRLPLLEKI